MKNVRCEFLSVIYILNTAHKLVGCFERASERAFVRPPSHLFTHLDTNINCMSIAIILCINLWDAMKELEFQLFLCFLFACTLCAVLIYFGINRIQSRRWEGFKGDFLCGMRMQIVKSEKGRHFIFLPWKLKWKKNEAHSIKKKELKLLVLLPFIPRNLILWCENNASAYIGIHVECSRSFRWYFVCVCAMCVFCEWRDVT